MTADELVTKADLERLRDTLLEAIKKISTPSDNRTLSLSEACQYLGGMKESTLRQMASTFEIASHKNGKHLTFEIRDLDAYQASTRRRSNAELAEMVR